MSQEYCLAKHSLTGPQCGSMKMVQDGKCAKCAECGGGESCG
jgi:hypothetical protein